MKNCECKSSGAYSDISGVTNSLLTTPPTQVEDNLHSMTMLYFILQLKTAASSGQTILLLIRRPQQSVRNIYIEESTPPLTKRSTYQLSKFIKRKETSIRIFRWTF